MLRSRRVPSAKALVLLLSALGICSAQVPEPGQKATPTLPEVRSELVQLDVTVSDKDGHNVSGLSVRDFVLLEDGRPQPLSHFAVGGRPALESAAPALPPPAAPAAPPAPPPPPAAPRGRHVVLLVDDLHTAQANLPQAQIAMRKFVTEQVSVDDRRRRGHHQRQRRRVPGLHERPAGPGPRDRPSA